MRIAPIPAGNGEASVFAFCLELIEKYNCYSLLDAGCGPGKYLHKLCSARWMESYAVDAHQPSLDRVNATVKICGEMPRVLRNLSCKSVDAAICLDVIEHFPKQKAEEVIWELEYIAKKVVILFTPYGFMPQPPAPDNPFQEHLCGFEPSELEALGYEAVVWEGFDYGKGLAGVQRALWGVKVL